jgi:hypothetical protein
MSTAGTATSPRSRSSAETWPDAEPSQPDLDALSALVERAVGGPERPECDYGHPLASS